MSCIVGIQLPIIVFCSEILYPKEGCSPHSGVSNEHLSKGRDYVVGQGR